MKQPSTEPFDLIIFGATGDLSKRKLLPALYALYNGKLIPQGSSIIAVGRQDLSHSDLLSLVKDSVARDNTDDKALKSFSSLLQYCFVDAEKASTWGSLKATLDASKNRVRVFYLAVSSTLYGPLCSHLSTNKLANQYSRLVVEKPIGQDLESAQKLNQDINHVFAEKQIFRIDHYLGKETVQNLMALRFANSLFEPIWNSHYIDHVQITAAETIGVEGRGGYYDKSGALRDMVQNHLLQLLCLTTMEPPNAFQADSVRDEKLKILKALKPITLQDIADSTVRGQYAGSSTQPTSYCDDVGNCDSETESYVAIRAEINNWRWAGTPFYLRTGKGLASRVSEIAVAFKLPPHCIFTPTSGVVYNNQLVIRVQPDESIVLHIMIKDPKRKDMGLINIPLDMTFAETLKGKALSDAYERLLLEVIRNDQTLFMRHDEVEAAWQWIDPIIASWEEICLPMHTYTRGSQGPNDAQRLISSRGDRFWRDL